jgi:hypothetical protein
VRPAFGVTQAEHLKADREEEKKKKASGLEKLDAVGRSSTMKQSHAAIVHPQRH